MLARRIILFCFGLLITQSSVALESVTLQLKWKHQFQFAGYYAAFVKGFYKEAGLDVLIKEAVVGQDPIASVIDGSAEYGVGTSELLLRHQEGAPVVVLGVIFQHSPLGLVVSQASGVEHVHDLVAKPLMIEANSAELFAFFAREGVNRDLLNIVHHSFDIRDLIDGRVAGMSVYTTDEPFALKQAGIDYSLFLPRQAGIDFYGDNFFTTRQEIEAHPERVQAFRAATIKGWKYAMAHPEEIIDLIYERYTQRHSRLHLAYEAKEMMRLLQADLVEPGYMHEGRWRHIADTYATQGLLKPDYDLSRFLYKPENGLDAQKVKQWVLGLVLIFVAIFAVLLYVWRLNRKLEDRENWLENVISHAPNALIVLNEKFEVHDWNEQAEAIFGWRIEEVKGRSAFEFLVPESERQHVEDTLSSILRTGELTRSENWNLTRDGKRIFCDWRNVMPQPDTIICMASDMTDRRRMEEELRELAHTDALTKVANRTLFFEKMEQSMLLAKRQDAKLAMLFIDLDDFKLVNDRYGHEVGDVVLVEVVQRIRMAIREADMLARIGGDEFVLMLYNCESVEKARQVAEKVLFVLERPLQVAGLSVVVGGSIGISLFPEHGTRVTELLKAADQAMYSVKGAGKNGIGLARARNAGKSSSAAGSQAPDDDAPADPAPD